MYLLNEKNPELIDAYSVSFDNLKFNVEKFSDLVKFSNPDLDKDFRYRLTHNGYIVNEKTPLIYPISTFLLASKLPYNLKDYASDNVSEHIYRVLMTYDTDNLFTIYDQISEDEDILSAEHVFELEEVLKNKYMDLSIFRGIFNKLSFRLIGSYNVGSTVRYTRSSKGNVIPALAFNTYMTANAAIYNSETLKILKLTPNIIKDI